MKVGYPFEITNFPLYAILTKFLAKASAFTGETPFESKKTKRSSSSKKRPLKLPRFRKSSSFLVTGTLTINPRKGFGFVHPSDPKDLAFDVFIPPGNLKGAIEGDVVSVRVSESGSNKDGKYKGTIQEVLSRKKPLLWELLFPSNPP